MRFVGVSSELRGSSTARRGTHAARYAVRADPRRGRLRTGAPVVVATRPEHVEIGGPTGAESTRATSTDASGRSFSRARAPGSLSTSAGPGLHRRNRRRKRAAAGRRAGARAWPVGAELRLPGRSDALTAPPRCRAAVSPRRLRSRDRNQACCSRRPPRWCSLLYAPPLAHLISELPAGGLSVTAYERILGHPFGRTLIWNSLRLGLITTAITLVVGYPAAFGLALSRGALRSIFLASLFLPLAASVIVKAFAWTILLALARRGQRPPFGACIDHRPIRLIFTQSALIPGSANIFLPFMILPIYAVVAQIDPRLSEAAATLGAPPVAAFVRVVVPLSVPGVVAGVALVFSLSVSAYVIPTLLMGENYPTLATTIAKAFLMSRDPRSARRPARS